MIEDTEKETPKQQDLLKDILANIQIDIEADKDNRKEMLDDLKFCTLDQWPAELRASRENDPNGARPCLTVDLTNQYITQVVNDMRQNKPGIKMRPGNDEASIEGAKVHQGLVRHIEDKSSATIAYENAGEWAVKTGRGYFRIVTEYLPGSFDQEPRIMPINDALSTYLGPHIMPDGSDAKRGTIIEELTTDEFKRLFPKAQHETASFDGLGEQTSTWRKDKTITVAEHFYTDYTEKTLLFLKNGETAYSDKFDGAADDIVEKRTEMVESIKWCKLTGLEILEERDWAGKYVPIVKVIGKKSVVEGKEIYWGLVRPIKDSLRMYNYWISAITEKIGLAPKTPFVGAVGQFEGKEEQWKNANKENRAYLEYNAIDANGNAIPAPQRVQPAPVEVAMVQMMGIIENQVRMTLGMYKASVGDSASQQSGKALGMLQRESDTGTFHFADNLAYSICYAGRILLDLNPKVIDTKRTIRILGDDDESKSAELDPTQPQSVRKIQTLNGVKNVYNLSVGEYNVSVTVGPSYNTKRMEAASVFTELARSTQDPGAASVMNYLAIKNSDVTSSDEAVTMLKALLPPQALQAEEQGPVPPQVMAQMRQIDQENQILKQQLQEVAQENQQLKSGAAEGLAKIQSDEKEAMAKLDLESMVQDKELKLAERKANKEIELKWAIANANHEIKQTEAMDTTNSEVDQAIAMVKNMVAIHETNMQHMISGGEGEHPDLESNTTSMMKMHEDFMSGIAQIIEGLNKKKSITMKSPSGGVYTATVQ